jgi:hypothetical protein
MGLAGPVDRAQFEALLKGELPNGIVLKRDSKASINRVGISPSASVSGYLGSAYAPPRMKEFWRL